MQICNHVLSNAHTALGWAPAALKKKNSSVGLPCGCPIWYYTTHLSYEAIEPLRHEAGRCRADLAFADRDLEGMQRLAFTLSLTKPCAVGVGTSRHLLPMTTTAGAPRHHHLSLGELTTHSVAMTRQFICNVGVSIVIWSILTITLNYDNSEVILVKCWCVWDLKQFELDLKWNITKSCEWSGAALHGRTCLSWTVAISCHSSSFPTVVAHTATPLLRSEIH